MDTPKWEEKSIFELKNVFDVMDAVEYSLFKEDKHYRHEGIVYTGEEILGAIEMCLDPSEFIGTYEELPNILVDYKGVEHASVKKM